MARPDGVVRRPAQGDRDEHRAGGAQPRRDVDASHDAPRRGTPQQYHRAPAQTTESVTPVPRLGAAEMPRRLEIVARRADVDERRGDRPHDEMRPRRRRPIVDRRPATVSAGTLSGSGANTSPRAIWTPTKCQLPAAAAPFGTNPVTTPVGVGGMPL